MTSQPDPSAVPPEMHPDGVRSVAVSIYWRADGWQRARSAFVGDLQSLPEAPSTLLGWVVDALDAYASRSVSEREQIRSALEVDRSPATRRVHWIPTDTMSRLDAAREADLRHGEILSRSEFAREAVETATRLTQDRLGRLPTPPRRLPPGRPPRSPEAR